MTSRQQYTLEKVEEQISVAKIMLEDILYRTEKLSQDEHRKVFEVLELVNQAKDKLTVLTL